MKKHDGDLSEAINVIATTMRSVREQAKAPQDEIHATIERLISLLRDQEVILINDVETIKHQKEKELQLQKDDLEFLLAGIRHAVLFSEAMMKVKRHRNFGSSSPSCRSHGHTDQGTGEGAP